MSYLKDCTTTTLIGLTEEAFCAWVGSAAPGDSIAYHRGFLAIDSALETCGGSPHDTGLLRVARRAVHLSQQGLVHLVQRREADQDFTYIAVARPRALSKVGALTAIMSAVYPDHRTTAATDEPGLLRRSA